MFKARNHLPWRMAGTWECCLEIGRGSRNAQNKTSISKMERCLRLCLKAKVCGNCFQIDKYILSVSKSGFSGICRTKTYTAK